MVPLRSRSVLLRMAFLFLFEAINPAIALSWRASHGRILRSVPPFTSACSTTSLQRCGLESVQLVAEDVVQACPMPASLASAWQEWPRTWVPVASVFELDPLRPTPTTFLGRNFVVWRDGAGEWRIFADACPHRLAPLSEGRIDKTSGQLECAYHGWQFDAKGACMRIPQMDAASEMTARESPRSCATAYPVLVEKGTVFMWPWQDMSPDSAPPTAMPAHLLATVPEGTKTYTRNLPYGWDTLVENLLDPGHVPFAHHGMQGKREDAIAISMSKNIDVAPHGFSFDFADRTMGLRRQGTGQFRAPYIVAYNGVFEKKAGSPPGPPRTFNLTVACMPRAAGRSRAIVYTGSGSSPSREPESEAGAQSGGARQTQKKKPRKSLVARVFGSLPVWLTHLLSSRFLDSDLAFLHFQEQEIQARGSHAYFMPAEADRCIAALRTWMIAHAPTLGSLPPPITDRSKLLSRWEQHGQHCVHCTAAKDAIPQWRRKTYLTLGGSVLLSAFWPARLVGALSVGLLYVLGALERQLEFDDFKHYKND